MLIHQFLDFVINIHEKGMNFGYLDFQNLYFVQNNHDQNKVHKTKTARTKSIGAANKYFSYELLFIEKNL